MNDIEKAIEILENIDIEANNGYSKEDVEYTYLMAILALEKQLNNGWIPVTERLPEKEEYLKNDGRFIVTDGNRRYQGWFDIYDGHFAKTSRDDVMKEDKCVIAWQPLPEPYKGE